MIIQHLDELIKGAVDGHQDEGRKAAITDSNTDSRLMAEFSGAIVPIYSLNEQYRHTETSNDLSPQNRSHSYQPKYSNYDSAGQTISSPPVQAALFQMQELDIALNEAQNRVPYQSSDLARLKSHLTRPLSGSLKHDRNHSSLVMAQITTARLSNLVEQRVSLKDCISEERTKRQSSKARSTKRVGVAVGTDGFSQDSSLDLRSLEITGFGLMTPRNPLPVLLHKTKSQRLVSRPTIPDKNIDSQTNSMAVQGSKIFTVKEKTQYIA